jgi:hypothetical protein
MKRKLAKSTVFILLVTGIVSLSSCKSETSIPNPAGTWKGTQNLTVAENQVTYLFGSDKTYTYKNKVMSDETGTYAYDGTTLSMTTTVSINPSLTVSGETGDTLTLSADSKSYDFTRQSGSGSIVGSWKLAITDGSWLLTFTDTKVIAEKVLEKGSSKVTMLFTGTYTLSDGTLALSFTSMTTKASYAITGNTMTLSYFHPSYSTEPLTCTLKKQ